jgi:hypothetical protein
MAQMNLEFIMSLLVRAELSIADHVWQKKHQAIADSVDSLGDQFRPLFRAGWLAYINKTYGAKKPRARQAPSLGQALMVVDG